MLPSGVRSSVLASLAALIAMSSASTSHSITQDGAERCLVAESPFWCLVEETSAGLREALSLAPEVSPRSITSQPLQLLSYLAADSLLLQSPSVSEADQESRGKKKRKYAYLLVAVASVFAVLLPFKLKAIALMAATALLVGKLALIIASLVGLKKLVQKQGDDTTHVHYSGHRSDPESHYLAYSELAPQGPQYSGPPHHTSD